MGVTVRQHHRGGWMVDVSCTMPSGERHRERRKPPVTAERAARLWGEKRLAHLVTRGLEPENKKEAPTLAAFWPDYVEKHLVARKGKHSSILSDTSRFNAHLAPQLGTKRLDAITAEDVAALRSRVGAGRTAKTVNNVLALLSKMLKVAKEWNRTESIVEVKMLRSRRGAAAAHPEDVYERLLAAARRVGLEAELVVLLGGDAGLRAGEMIGLRWPDVDLEGRTLVVRRAVYRNVVDSTKGDVGRPLPLSDRLREALAAHKHLRGPWVLCNERGKRIGMKWLETRVAASERIANLEPDGKLHMLRHTFGTRLARRGVSVKSLQALMGHENVATTMGYIDLYPADLEAAIASLNPGTRWAPEKSKAATR